jgi:hypothetical protein
MINWEEVEEDVACPADDMKTTRVLRFRGGRLREGRRESKSSGLQDELISTSSARGVEGVGPHRPRPHEAEN